MIHRFGVPRSRWTLPGIFTALTLGFIVLGWLALVLAEFGWFTLGSVLVVWGLLVGGLIAWSFVYSPAVVDHHQPQDFAAPEVDPNNMAKWEWLLLAVWLVAAGWLFLRPHEYIFGGADAGVYVSLGAEVARHGSFRVVDPTLMALDPALREAVMRPLPNTPGADAYLLPGFYVTDPARGELTPQFYPFHPTLQAIAFALAGGDAGGIRAELLLGGLWAILGSLAIYLHTREIGGRIAAVLVLVGLTVTALQMWFARYPTSEALSQFLLWSGLWATGRWLTEAQPQKLWAFTAGSAFGAFFLVRIDAIVLLPVFVLLLVWRWVRGWRTADSWFAIPLVSLFVHSLLHGHFLGGPYFYETIGYATLLLTRLWPLWISLAVLGVGFLWLVRGRGANMSAPERLKQPILAVLIIAVLVFAFYGWFIRPTLGQTTMRPDVFSGGEIPVTNHENWPRLGWYLTPLGIWLGIVGSCLLLWRVNRRTAVTLATGFLFTGLYLWNISANPHHVYVMRRYIPAVVPFLTLSAAYLVSQGFEFTTIRSKLPGRLAQLPPLLAPIISTLVVVLWLGGLVWAARGYASQVDHAGLIGQVDGLAGRLPAGSILLFNDQSPVGLGDIWGTPLRFVYGYDVFTLRRSDVDPVLVVEAIMMWQNSGRQVVWIGDPGWLEDRGFGYRTETVGWVTQRLESSYTQKPRKVVPNETTLMLHFIE
jgi:hypothetical protein